MYASIVQNYFIVELYSIIHAMQFQPGLKYRYRCRNFESLKVKGLCWQQNLFGSIPALFLKIVSYQSIVNLRLGFQVQIHVKTGVGNRETLFCQRKVLYVPC